MPLPTSICSHPPIHPHLSPTQQSQPPPPTTSLQPQSLASPSPAISTPPSTSSSSMPSLQSTWGNRVNITTTQQTNEILGKLPIDNVVEHRGYPSNMRRFRIFGLWLMVGQWWAMPCELFFGANNFLCPNMQHNFQDGMGPSAKQNSKVKTCGICSCLFSSFPKRCVVPSAVSQHSLRLSTSAAMAATMFIHQAAGCNLWVGGS